MAERTCSVVILGGGIVGICCGLALVKAGADVTLIDKSEPGQGASSGNAGVVSPWSIIPQSMPGLWQKIPRWLMSADGPVAVKPSYLPKLTPWVLRFLREGQTKRVAEIAAAMEVLNRDNVNLYRQLLSQAGHTELIRDSYYVHAFRNAGQANLDSIDYAIRRQHGADLEHIRHHELQQLEPALSERFEAAILIKHQARLLSPGRVGNVLMEAFRRIGGRYLAADIKRLSPRTDSGWLLEAQDEKIAAGKVVVAAGAWSNQLLKPLSVGVPMEAERGYHLEFPGSSIQLTHSVMDMDLKIVASSMEGGLRAAGTAEFAGLDTPPNKKRVNSLRRAVQSMLPGLDSNECNHWMGSRPSMPDSLPCIGEFRKHQGLIAAFGHGHYGLMMAPKTGRIIADIALEKPTDIDLSPYHPERFR